MLFVKKDQSGVLNMVIVISMLQIHQEIFRIEDLRYVLISYS